MRKTRIRLGAAALLSLILGSGHAAWQTDWNESGPMFDMRYGGDVAVVGASDGAALVGFSDTQEYRLSRVRADGSLVWHLALPLRGSSSPADLFPEADGATLVTFTGSRVDSVMRVDAAGALQWSMAIHGKRFAVGGNRIVASVWQAGGDVITAIDRNSGDWRWQIQLNRLHTGLGGGVPLAVDADGNTYLAGYLGNAQAQLVKFDAQGVLLWSRPVEPWAVGAMAVQDGRVYLGGSQLHAFDAADGAPRWHTDRCGILDRRIRFVASDPLCISQTALSRLAGNSGAEIWRRDVPTGSGSQQAVVDILGSDVYVLREIGAWPQVTSTLDYLSGSDGKSRWRRSLSYPVRERLWSLPGGGIGIVGPGTAPETVAVRRYRTDDGSLSDTLTLPDVARGVQEADEIRDGADVFALARAAWKTLPQRVRRIAADSGSVIWENTATALDLNTEFAVTPNRLLLADQLNGTEARVRSIDRADGVSRWERIIPDRPTSRWLYPPRLIGLGDDDALVSYGHGFIGPNGSPSFRAQELQRLGGAAGNILWSQRIGEWSDPGNLQPREPVLIAVDEDAVLWRNAGVGADPTLPLQRRSGSDGQLQFSNLTIAATHVRASVASDAVFGAGVRSGVLQVASHDSGSGQRRWLFEQAYAPWRAAEVHDLLPLADGDVIVLMLQSNPSVAGLQQPRLLRIRNDGSGLRYAVDGLMPTTVHDFMDRIVAITDGEALLRRRLYDGRRGLDFLQRFDLAQGRVIGTQVLAPIRHNPFEPHTLWNLDMQPRGDVLLASGTTYRFPQPTTRRDALLDIAVRQRGDLALQLLPFAAGIAVGDTLPFDVGVRYSGDAAITDATLMLELPWPGVENDLACDGPGIGRCEIQVSHGQILAQFDAAPGAALSLRGGTRVLAAPAPDRSTLRALVFAPVGLLESELANNLRSIPAEATLFADGFERSAGADRSP